MYFLKVARFMACPMEGCQFRATIRINIWVHFMHHYVQDAVVILDKVKILHTL